MAGSVGVVGLVRLKLKWQVVIGVQAAVKFVMVHWGKTKVLRSPASVIWRFVGRGMARVGGNRVAKRCIAFILKSDWVEVGKLCMNRRLVIVIILFQ